MLEKFKLFKDVLDEEAGAGGFQVSTALSDYNSNDTVLRY